MELELKHLSPYLPYELKVLDKWNIQYLLTGFSAEGGNHFKMIELMDNSEGRHFANFIAVRPILRPLSDLTKTVFKFEYGEPTTLEDWINGNCDLGQLKWVLQDIAKEQRQERIMDLPYFVAEYLFQYHFDIFGLIDEGLAVDINTIQK